MRLLLVLLFVLPLPSCATTDDPLKAQKERAELIERCRKLKKERDEYKGKPIRRNASDQYYRDECLNIYEPIRN